MPAIRLARPGMATALILAFGGCAKAPPPQPPPPPVTVAAVVRRDVPVTQEWVASLYGFVDAQIRAQVSGYLLKQDYADGAFVHAGDPLFEIDPRPFQAALDQAKAQVALARAQLGKAQQDVRRYGPLAQDQAISQQEFDDAVQAELGAKAQVAAGEAALERASLDLGFTHLVSPITGIAGIVQAQVGDLVGPGTGALTTVSTLDPMKVYFPIGEQDYLDLGRDHGGGFPPEAQLELILADGSVYPEKGRFYAEDRQIDPTTGTLRVAATFPNPKNALRPGQYGRVRAVIRTLPGALLVPPQALNELQGGYQVATVDESNRAHIVTVTTGPRLGSLIVIASGLKPGERVIVDGFAKARDGQPVNPQPAR